MDLGLSSVANLVSLNDEGGDTCSSKMHQLQLSDGLLSLQATEEKQDNLEDLDGSEVKKVALKMFNQSVPLRIGPAEALSIK